MNKPLIAFSAAFIVLSGYLAVGCGSKHRPTFPPPEAAPAPVNTQAAPKAVHNPFEAKGGRLFDPDNIREPWAPPGRWREVTPGRVKVWIPHFLNGFGGLEDGAIQEILNVTPQEDFRIPSNYKGVDPEPTGYLPVLVVIMDPGGYSLISTINGDQANLVAGHWLVESWVDAQGNLQEWDVLYVSWRYKPYKEYPLLPALDHEIRHRLTRDPLAGH